MDPLQRHPAEPEPAEANWLQARRWSVTVWYLQASYLIIIAHEMIVL